MSPDPQSRSPAGGTRPTADEVVRTIRELPPDEMASLIARLPKLTMELSPDSHVLHQRELDPYMTLIETLIAALGKVLEVTERLADRKPAPRRGREVFALLQGLPERERDLLFALVEHRTQWAVRVPTAEQWVEANVEEQLDQWQQVYDEDTGKLIDLLRAARKSKAGPAPDPTRRRALAMGAALREAGAAWEDVLTFVNEIDGKYYAKDIASLGVMISRMKRDAEFLELVAHYRKESQSPDGING